MSSFWWKPMKLKLNAVMKTAVFFHRMDEVWLNFEDLLRHCEQIIPLRCEPIIFLTINILLCQGLYILWDSFFNESEVFVAEDRSIGWRHQTDVFQWKCIPVHLSFYLSGRYRALVVAFSSTVGAYPFILEIFLSVWTFLGMRNFHAYVPAFSSSMDDDTFSSWAIRSTRNIL